MSVSAGVPTTPGPTSADLSKRCWALEGSAARALAGKVRMIIKARQNMSGRSSGVPGQHAAASERRKGASRGVHEEPDLQSLQPPGMGPPLAADRVSTTGGPAAAPVCRAEHPDAAGATAAAALAGPERSSGAAAVTVRNIPTAMPKFADSAFGSIAMERWRPFRARGTDTGMHPLTEVSTSHTTCSLWLIDSGYTIRSASHFAGIFRDLLVLLRTWPETGLELLRKQHTRALQAVNPVIIF